MEVSHMLLGAKTAAACRRTLVLLTTTLFLFQGNVALMRGEPNTTASEKSEPDHALSRIKHFVVIYQENWSFDSLYGLFPGANGLAQSSPKSLNQTDRFDKPLSAQTGMPFSLVSGSLSLTTPPPPINNNVKPAVVDTRFNSGLNTLLPYNVLTN